LKTQNHVRVATEAAPKRAKLVIRLQFVILKRASLRQQMRDGTSLVAS